MQNDVGNCSSLFLFADTEGLRGAGGFVKKRPEPTCPMLDARVSGNRTKRFAGLVPPNTPDGDQAITATYYGASTRAGTLLTIHR